MLELCVHRDIFIFRRSDTPARRLENLRDGAVHDFFVTPEGTGTYTVTEGGGFKTGAYPAGETASLGAFHTRTTFKVVGADVPAVRVFVSGRW